MNRTAAIGRLKLGRSLGAEVKPTKTGHRAWIFVEPLMDSNTGNLIEAANWTIEPKVMPKGIGQNPIRGFDLVLKQLSRAYEQSPDDWDIVGLEIDERQTFVTIEALEKSMQQRFALKLEHLVLPHDLEDPF